MLVHPIRRPHVYGDPVLVRSGLDRHRVPVLSRFLCVGNFALWGIANGLGVVDIANAVRDERLQRWQFSWLRIANAVDGEEGRDYLTLPVGGF